ncbi:MAG TPA: GntR family transcriptional regulator [Gemmatimonadaceae bacterium]|nr:GntR family transcriptional regulator [Gemmatimonadaceae bacterium]
MATTSPKRRPVPAAQVERRRSRTVVIEDQESAAGTTSRGERISRAYEQVRQMIVWGRLAPGTRIVEAEIAKRLGVSRTPTRSAIHRLQQEGYVTALDRAKERRLIVAPLTQEDARELFDIVGQLEGLAARGAAALGTKPRAALVQKLRRMNSDLGSAARQRRPDPMGLFDLDMAFHRAYVEAGAGPRLLALHEATKPQAERYIRLYISSLVDEIATSVGEHDVIVRRIEAGDTIAAERAVDENWENAARRLSKVIEALGERGSW